MVKSQIFGEPRQSKLSQLAHLRSFVRSNGLCIQITLELGSNEHVADGEEDEEDDDSEEDDEEEDDDEDDGEDEDEDEEDEA